MKTTFQILITLAAAVIALNSCREDDSYKDMLIPWKAPEKEITGEILVGANYDLSFNDTNWLSIDDLYLPELGKYNSLNPAVIRQHIDWSLQSGIDFWVIGHSRANDSIIINVLGGISEFESLGFVMDMNFSTRSAIMDLTDSASIQRVIADVKSMSALFESSNYLKIDDKPVIVLQGTYSYNPRPDLLAGATTDDRVDAMARLRTILTDSTGYEFYFIANYVGWSPPERYGDYLQTFDALTSDMMTNRKAVTNFFNENIELSWDNWKTYLDSRSVAFAPGIFPGRNDTVISTSRADVLQRSPEFFTDQIKLAKYFMDDDLRIILIDSFNGWHSGTQVEPADNYGKTYIDILKNEFSAN